MFMGSIVVKETAQAIGMLTLQDLLSFSGRAYAYELANTPSFVGTAYVPRASPEMRLEPFVASVNRYVYL